MQRWVVISWALLTLVGADECPDGGRCTGGQTCCNSPANGYECCPFDQAECCEDHIHCCPANTLCDTATSGCVNATVSIPWKTRSSADQPSSSRSFRMIKTNMGEEDDNICPDHSRCPAEFSCLKALTRFGCCPLAQGVPCSDGKHCCPEGHQCSADSRSCIKKDVVSTVLCKDGVSECPDDTTCCETPEGSWGCCPLPKAVCCSDKMHCCPEDSTCDVEHSKCISIKTKKVMPMWAKLPARLRAEWENQKDAEVVSAITAGSEKVPEATTANQVPHSERTGSVSPDSKPAASVVPCNETVGCPDESTCCQTKEGEWQCCPLPQAICCEDHVHCCPHGYKCNLPEQQCDSSLQSVPWVEKVPVIHIEMKIVQCDDTSACPDDTTCCKTKEGGWACCPLPKAVCCNDFLHCCPHGTTCNLAAQSCDDSLQSVPWVQKLPAIQKQGVQVKIVPCDDTSSCPDDTTCCKTKEGGWACCPLPKAVCCDDHEHCCPNNSTCDLATLTCDTASGPTAMKQKIPAFASTTPKTVPTLPSNEKEKKVEERMKAEEGDDDDDDDEEEENKQGSAAQCDAHTFCPPSTTCCYMKKHQMWGCCPLPEAVCCSDGSHCCPTHYTCNEGGATCRRGEVVIPWYTKVPAISTGSTADHGSVRCDGSIQCPESTTCCSLLSGEWGCCPLTNAVCCPDKEHCCPQGYTCNMASGSCQRLVMLQLDTIPLTPVFLPQPLLNSLKDRDIQCDEVTKCRDGQTCCKMSATTWGCCPSPNAVCCSDMRHCCPTGYTCTEAGECIQNTGLDWHSWHYFLNKRKALTV